MKKKEQTNQGGLLKYAKEEYLFLHKKQRIIWWWIIKEFLINDCFRCNVLINWLQQPGKMVRKKIVKNHLETKYRVVISLNSKIGQHFRVISGEDIVIGEGVQIGERCCIYGKVTLGQKRGKVPQIGSDVIIQKGAVVFGNVCIGDNVIINENSVVIHDIPTGTVVEGNPAKVISTKA